MYRITISTLALVLVLSMAPIRVLADKITLPTDKSTLRESELPGYAIALQKCGICHSADYISYQPPAMNQTQWTAEMAKMQHSYGAPISSEEIELIGAYLAVAYGSAKASDPSVLSLSSSVASPEAAIKVDVQPAGIKCLSRVPRY